MRTELSFRVVAPVLLVLCLLVRLPFFFPAVINWDESTYILMGQSLADGHLPYVRTIDMKPPLAYLPYALAILTLGKHIASVRLAGAVCVALSAFAVYFIGLRLWDRNVAVMAAVLCILGITLLPSGQATLTEHIVLPFLLGALCLAILPSQSLLTAAGAGVLMSAATLVRQNMAFATVVVGLGVLVLQAPSLAERFKRAAIYGVSGLILLAGVCLPFAWAGQLSLLWNATVMAPLRYSGSQNSVAGNATGQALNAFVQGPYLNMVIWAAAAAGLIQVMWLWRGYDRDQRRRIGLVVAAGAATAFGVLSSGPSFEHYLIQVVPFGAILAAALVCSFPRAAFGAIVTAGLAVSLVSLAPVLTEYRQMFARVRAHEPLPYGAAYEIADYLNQGNPQHRPVYLLTDHIVYWLTDLDPPTPLATHPSAIGKDAVLSVVGTNGERELAKILAVKPEFIVRLDKDPFPQDAANELLNSTLRDHYVLATRIRDRNVYQRTGY